MNQRHHRTNRIFTRVTYRCVAAALGGACLFITSACSQAVDVPPRLVARSDKVYLLTPVAAGEGGWCITTVLGRCAPAVTFGESIVGESWSGFGPPTRSVGVVVTKNIVRFVKINGGAAIATHAEALLPDGLRAAVVELRGPNGSPPAPFPHFTPLSPTGRQIRQDGALTSLPFRLPVRAWRPPVKPPQGMCRMRARPADGIVAREGVVVPHVTRHVGVAGRPFLSCLGIAYDFEDNLLVGSVLVDASRPGVTPATIPGMVAVAGRPGVFRAPSAEGEMVARRIPGAWLVVTRGAGLEQRLSLLKRLTARVML